MINITLTSALDEAMTLLDECQVKRGINRLVSNLYSIRNTVTHDRYKQAVDEVCNPHTLYSYIHQCPYARRSFCRPRGYAGDAVLLDYFYGLHGPDMNDTALGKAIFDVSMASSSAKSVRYRRMLVAQIIDEIAERDPSAQILSIACGHIREAEISVAVRARRVGLIVALDQDSESIDFVRREADRNGWAIEPVCGSIRSVLSRKVKVDGAAFVYAAGLYDYLEMPLAARLTARMFEMLRKGGRLLVANFAPETIERGYMEAFMNWFLIYRDEVQVASFAAEIPREQIAAQRIYRDPEGNVVYLELTRQ